MAAFSAKLIPNVERERFLGLTSAQVKDLAKEAVADGSYKSFLQEDHYYFEEFSLHATILCSLKFDSAESLCAELEKFLPQVNNWAVCDTLAMGLKKIKKYPDFFYEKCKVWLRSERTYTVRFAIVVLLDYYLDENLPAETDALANMCSDEFYIQMALAWFWSFALVKQYDAAIPYFENKEIKDVWVHNKGIQKAKESYRVSDETKAYLASLKIKSRK